MVSAPGGAKGGQGGQGASKQRAAQLEKKLKMKQAEMKILDTTQKRVEGELNQDIGMTFGGLGGGR